MIRVYIDNVPVITRDYFMDQTKSLEKVLYKLTEVRLKANIEW